MSNSMDKLNMKTKDIIDENIDFIESKFPNAITETKDKNGKIVKKIDFGILKRELSFDIVDNAVEKYSLNWPGKKDSILNANSQINKTLRPCKEESLDFEDTGNLYIEGDNLEVLKLLRETYLGKIKMIYMDPPYNTGNDFIYNDDFSQSSEEYLKETSQLSEEGYKIVQNTESNGKFHSDWLSMMYPRLKIAKDLLSDDGIIFISIDDNEQATLKMLCDEIFGSHNFLITMCINRTSEIATNSTIFMHEYALVYLKNNSLFNLVTSSKYTISRGTVGNPNQTMPVIEFPAGLSCYNLSDGTYNETRKIVGSSENIENLDPIIIENGKLKYPVRLKARWRSSNDMRNFFNNDCRPTKAKINGNIVEIFFNSDRFNPQIKKETYEKIPSMYLENKRGSEDLEKLSMGGTFDYPKSVSLINYFAQCTHDSDIILDFFSGSATTAQAVMQLNAEDDGHRKFIMVQIREEVSESRSPAAVKFLDSIGKPHYITEIGKERIRRAGQKILNENPSLKGKLDVGFRDFKLDISNMKDVYYSPEEYTQDLLASAEDNILEDRTPLDLVFQVMLELGITLDSKIEEQIIRNKKVYVVKENTADEEPALICCFDPNVTEEVVIDIAKLKPLRVVFRDSSMKNDNVYINFDQIFETYSPGTKRRVL